MHQTNVFFRQLVFYRPCYVLIKMDATAAITSLASKWSQLVEDAFASVFFFSFLLRNSERKSSFNWSSGEKD